MKRFTFKSTRARLIFWFLAISVIPMLTSFAILYYQRARIIRQGEITKLVAIRDLKAAQVSTWLEGRKNDINIISKSPILQGFEDLKYVKNILSYNSDFSQNVRLYLNAWVNNYPDYKELLIVDPRSYNVLVSTSQSSQGNNLHEEQFLTTTMSTGKGCISDIYLSKFDGKPQLSFSNPVYSLVHPEKIIAIIMVNIDLENSLYRILLNRTGLDNTGESLLVNQYQYAVSSLRWLPHAPTTLKLNTLPSYNSTHGQTGYAETKDYRGEPILAVYTYIPLMKWGFIVKQDLAEVEAPIIDLFKFIVALFIAFLLLIILLAGTVSKNMVRPVREMAAVALRIRQGDFKARILNTRHDETGVLAVAINSLTETVEQEMEIQKHETLIASQLVDERTSESFGHEVLTLLMNMSGSLIAGFYELNSDKKCLELRASIGLSEDSTSSYSIENLEGDMGKLITEHEILHLVDLPPDTNIIHKTIVGTIVPGHLLYIPVLLDTRELEAVIVLGSLLPFSLNFLKAMENVRHTLSSAYSRTIHKQEIRKFTNQLEKTNSEILEQSRILKMQAEELQAQTEELQQQSLEMHSQNVELEMQKTQISEANRLKTDFLSNMSHELRTPLNSIIGLSRILLKQSGENLSEDELSYLQIIERNGRSLLSLINDILDLSKIESGKMQVMVNKFSVAQVLDDIISSHKHQAESKSIFLSLRIPDDLPMVENDEKKLAQVLENVINNAIKFTAKGGVTVNVAESGGTLSIEVIDTGIGIPEEHLPFIFDQFRQVDSSLSRSYEGTGLGLSIARKLLGLMNGSIGVGSTVDSGSTFTISLPLRWQGSDAGEDHYGIVNETHDLPSPEISKPLHKARLLIVDDNAIVIHQLKMMLEEEGYIIDTSNEGREALDYLETTIPDGIILDLMMPNMDGFAFLKSIRSKTETKTTPVLILTAKNLLPEELNMLTTNHVNQLIQKGDINKSELLRKIRNLLNQPPLITYKTEKPSIMIIEDDPDNMITVKAILQENFKIQEAADGITALEMLSDYRPDIILMDINLPKMDGYSLVKKIRTKDEFSKTAILAITGFAIDFNLEKYKERGFDDCILKPVDADQLLANVMKWVKSKND